MITVGYSDNKIAKFKQFEDITNQEDIINCSNNSLHTFTIKYQYA
jgi:hypothetical protein